MGAPLFLPRRPATVQPPAGTPLDRSNPIARLGVRLAFSAGSQIDPASNVVSSAPEPTVSAWTNGLIAGPFNAAPYPSFATFPVKQSGAFTVVAYGQFRYCGGKGPILSHYGGSGGWKFGIFNNNFSYTQFGVADYALATVAAGYTGVVVAVVTPGVNIKIYTNGVLSETVTIGAMSASSGNGTLVIGNRSGGTDTALGSTQLAEVLYIDAGLNDAQVAAISANSWQAFEGPRGLLPLTSAAVADTSISGSSATAAASTGALSTSVALAGSAATGTAASGALSTSVALAGSSATLSGASGALSTGIALAGMATTPTVSTGTLTAPGAGLGGMATTPTVSTGALTTGVALAGASVTPSTSTGSMAAPAAELAGQSSTLTRSAGGLLTGIALTGSASTRVAAAGALTSGIALSGGSFTSSRSRESAGAQIVVPDAHILAAPPATNRILAAPTALDRILPAGDPYNRIMGTT